MIKQLPKMYSITVDSDHPDEGMHRIQYPEDTKMSEILMATLLIASNTLSEFLKSVLNDTASQEDFDLYFDILTDVPFGAILGLFDKVSQDSHETGVVHIKELKELLAKAQLLKVLENIPKENGNAADPIH